MSKKKMELSGLSKWSDMSSSKPLTLEDFEKSMNYLMSDEYHEKEQERQRVHALGEMTLNKALDMDLITENEYWHLRISLNINGALMVSSEMYHRIEPASKIIAERFSRA